ncbi:unnamed protein product [Staurois parvus]|uniref:Uncharacterized protein n=1 Tax=Staurois parvus TaxID=386267 RepID=A0ABN9FKM4_9NEOB|nr:unnamed protein product [Staurois parvus]
MKRRIIPSRQKVYVQSSSISDSSLTASSHTMFQPLHGRTVPELSLIVYF